MDVKRRTIFNLLLHHTNAVVLSVLESDIEIRSKLIDAFLERYNVLMLGLIQAHVQILLRLDVKQLVNVDVRQACLMEGGVVLPGKLELGVFVFLHENIWVVTSATVVAEDYESDIALVVVGLGRANYHWLLVSDFAGDHSLAFKNRLDGKFAVFLEGRHKLNRGLILDVLVVAKKFSRQQVVEQDGLTVVDIVLIVGEKGLLLIERSLKALGRSEQKDCVAGIGDWLFHSWDWLSERLNGEEQPLVAYCY